MTINSKNMQSIIKNFSDDNITYQNLNHNHESFDNHHVQRQYVNNIVKNMTTEDMSAPNREMFRNAI